MTAVDKVDLIYYHIHLRRGPVTIITGEIKKLRA